MKQDESGKLADESGKNDPMLADESGKGNCDETSPLVPKDEPKLMKHHPSAKPSSHRYVYSDMVPREVKTSHTVAALFLGEGSWAEHLMFEVGVKNPYHTSVIWGLWYIGAIVSLAAVGGFLSKTFVWASLLMLPLPILTVLLVSTDLLKELCTSMDLYIIYILQFAFMVDGVFYCKQDIRRVFWYCYLLTMIASGLVDAYPAKFRAFFAKLFFWNAIGILAVFNALLFFKWEAFGDLTKLANVSFTLHHISDQLTLGVFYCRHIYCSTYYPNYFVMIKAEVLTGKVKEPTADSPKRATDETPSARRMSFAPCLAAGGGIPNDIKEVPTNSGRRLSLAPC